ncbi:Hypothetical protein NTJ_08606 [Nesidiocoris tenuis]|uniref:AATF leucine zipper-containing domain-containing protein n=1 Tax=Nesidiocoris tenuis TaxID=355587 RepID=A0ABN7AZ81_9HEMI|nr:Hypothetical protein NTJ_08606 [Nesidiocoris tenuis]
MSLREQIEKSLSRENNEVDAVEDEVMKDSVLAIASADFKEQDVLDLPLTSRKRSTIDLDVGYPGKSVSRKRYRQDVGMEDKQNDDSDDSSASMGGGLIGFDDEDPSLDEEEEGDEEDSVDDNDDGTEEGDVDDEQEDEEEGGDDEEEPSEDDSDVDLAPHQSKNVSDDLEDQTVKMFSEKRTDSAEIRKGLALREQLRFWESILECRIKLEPSLVAANQLFQLGKMSKFLSEEKSTSSSDADSALTALRELSSAWGRLQEQLTKQCSEDSPDKKSANTSRKSKPRDDSDEENDDDESIRSSEASGVESNASSEDEADSEAKSPSNSNLASEPFSLDRSYAQFASFRDSEIERWNEKAKISSGRAAQRDFSAFDQSILKLIESILYDKYRLVRKTQLKRLDYVIYGKSEEKEPQGLKNDDDSQQKDQIIAF